MAFLGLSATRGLGNNDAILWFIWNTKFNPSGAETELFRETT